MEYAETISRKVATLPLRQQAEVLDFVEFLATRHGGTGEWTDATFETVSMAQALRGMEDEPVAYSASDLRERWR